LDISKVTNSGNIPVPNLREQTTNSFLIVYSCNSLHAERFSAIIYTYFISNEFETSIFREQQIQI